jgi:hypothetical protein
MRVCRRLKGICAKRRRKKLDIDLALRDPNGRIKRSSAAKEAFERQSGYPQGRPGHVVDHIKPLACGGADDSSNTQWQSIADAKAKDKVERQDCR